MCYPVQLAEYYIQNGISSLPIFDCCIPFVIKKNNRIIAKIKSKYWIRIQKLGIDIPKSVEDSKQINQANHNTNWWDAICKEINNVRVAFEKYDMKQSEIPSNYIKINCHPIFAV